MIRRKIWTAALNLLLLATASLLLMIFPVNARADAIYTASASASIALVGFRNSSGAPLFIPPSALSVTSQNFFVVENHSASGNASASADGSVTVVGTGLLFEASASGQAGGPSGVASSDALSGATITLQNSSLTEGFFIDFTASLEYVLEPSIASLTTESADASIRVMGGDGTFLVNFFDIVFAPNTRAPGSFSSNFSLFISPGQTINLNASLDVGGHAQVVPEPTTLLIMATGLAGVAAEVRKRRKSGRGKDA